MLQRFQPLGVELLKSDLWSLELGSTILFFYEQSKDWTHALTRACEFKKVRPNMEASQTAMELAKRVQASAGIQ